MTEYIKECAQCGMREVNSDRMEYDCDKCGGFMEIIGIEWEVGYGEIDER